MKGGIVRHTTWLRSFSAVAFLALMGGLTSGASARPAPVAPALVPAGNAFVDGLTSEFGLTGNMLTFPAGDMASPVYYPPESPEPHVVGYDFSPDGSVLYGVDGPASKLITVNQDAGSRASVGNMTKSPSEEWEDLIIDPVTGAAYAAASGDSSYTLYTLNLATGATTPIATVPTTAFPTDLSMNCAGQMYAEGTGDDLLYSVDPSTAELTPIGPLGVNIDGDQGMDFDNATGVLHAWLFLAAGTHQYSSLNLSTGAATPFPGSAPNGEFEGAIKSSCPAPTATVTSGPSGHTADRRPRFGYSATNAMTVECSVDAGSPVFAPCGATSFQPLADLAPGSYTFRLRATNRVLSVQSTRAFTVVDCAPLKASVAKAKKKVKRAKARLTAAKRTGNTQAIARAATKLKKAKQKLKKAKAALAAEPACR